MQLRKTAAWSVIRFDHEITRRCTMQTIIKRFKAAPIAMLVLVVCMLLASGCARYARNLNVLYQPSATVSGGAGDVYIVIPENRTTQSSDIKWVLGTIKNDDNKIVDELYSPRSPEEIIQAAFGREFKRAGYNVIPTTKRPVADQRLIDITRAAIELEQISDLADLKANCRVLVGVDVFKDGQQVKRIQYEATSSRTDIKDRDLLAESVLDNALQSVMQRATPELHDLLNRKQ